MKKLEKLTIVYTGIQDPSNEKEVMLEIAGLNIAKAEIDRRIAILKQALIITDED